MAIFIADSNNLGIIGLRQRFFYELILIIVDFAYLLLHNNLRPSWLVPCFFFVLAKLHRFQWFCTFRSLSKVTCWRCIQPICTTVKLGVSLTLLSHLITNVIRNSCWCGCSLISAWSLSNVALHC